MNFSQLLAGLGVSHSGGDPEISGLDYNSRRVEPGFVFVAMHGETSDGNRYIDAALKNGAVAVATDSKSEPPRPDLPWAVVPNGRRALSHMSANFYGHPAKKLAITGITGTNGKSTTAFLIEAILRAAGRSGALVGTIEYHVAGKVLPAPHTTPESLDLQRLFCDTVAAGGTEVVMEVSSHALAQGRTYGIPFDVAVFTNLTRDHLDYHQTMEKYYLAKRLLFDGTVYQAPRVAVINAHDERSKQIAAAARRAGAEVRLYGIGAGEWRAASYTLTPGGAVIQLETPSGNAEVQSHLAGEVNILNLLAAFTAAHARGIAFSDLVAAIPTLRPVPGRFQPVDVGQPFTVIVDYAHTDDALRNLTALARQMTAQAGKRVITVFGCGGDRDRTKRPRMGAAAGAGSDFVVATSDNPRSEDPLAILAEIEPGLKSSGVRYAIEPDRTAAIRMAIEAAEPGDVVLIAGKGHEKEQILNGRTIPFDDAEVAGKALRELGARMGYGKEQ